MRNIDYRSKCKGLKVPVLRFILKLSLQALWGLTLNNSYYSKVVRPGVFAVAI